MILVDKHDQLQIQLIKPRNLSLLIQDKQVVSLKSRGKIWQDVTVFFRVGQKVLICYVILFLSITGY